jgi:hypothetical protein
MTRLILTLCLLSFPALAQTEQVQAVISFVNIDDYDITAQEFSEVTTTGSNAWWVRQCCLQNSTRQGMISDQCFTEYTTDLIEQGICDVLLIEPSGGE